MWIPLESNPDMLTTFVRKLGVPAPWHFCDVFGLDEELLQMVPQPCRAVVLLYPTPQLRAFKEEQRQRGEREGQLLSENLFYMKQHDHVGNACGTIGTIHALANAVEPGDIAQLGEGELRRFVEQQRAAAADPAQIGEALAQAQGIRTVSEEAATLYGQTEAPPAEEQLEAHFCAFVQVDNNLYELDGRKAFPINHGPTTQDTFLVDAARVVRSCFMEKDPTALGFNLMALVQAPPF